MTAYITNEDFPGIYVKGFTIQDSKLKLSVHRGLLQLVMHY